MMYSSTLLQNNSAPHAGGIYATGSATLSIGDFSVIGSNRATQAEGGAMEFEIMNTVTIGQNVVIEDNVAATRAGGFYMGTSGSGLGRSTDDAYMWC